MCEGGMRAQREGNERCSVFLNKRELYRISRTDAAWTVRMRRCKKCPEEFAWEVARFYGMCEKMNGFGEGLLRSLGSLLPNDFCVSAFVMHLTLGYVNMYRYQIFFIKRVL